MVFGPSFHFRFHFSMCTHRHTMTSKPHTSSVQMRLQCTRHHVSLLFVSFSFFFMYMCLYIPLELRLVGWFVRFCTRFLSQFLRIAPCACVLLLNLYNLRIIAMNENWRAVWWVHDEMCFANGLSVESEVLNDSIFFSPCFLFTLLTKSTLALGFFFLSLIERLPEHFSCEQVAYSLSPSLMFFCCCCGV